MEVIEYGICRLALVPVRKGHGDATAQVTQLLFGDHYEVFALSKDKKWLQIKTVSDQCEGWIDEGHHHAISREYFDQVNHADFKITTDITASMLYKKSGLTILMGSNVPISTSELFKMEEQLAFNGESKSLGQKRDHEFVQSIAVKYVNAPYQTGGKSPFGIDGPGLVHMVYKISGYCFPRDFTKLQKMGTEVDGIAHARSGDLAFFGSAKGDVTHVGIVLTEERVIHAHGRVRIDHLNEEGILNMETRVYSHHLSFIRRITNE